MPRTASSVRCLHSLLHRSLTTLVAARFIDEAVAAGVRAFSVESRVIRVKANQFYECPWNNDNTACCLSSADPVPKTAGPRGRTYHRVGATLHYGRELRERLCTTECLWVGEDCEKASAQRLTGYMEGSPERSKLVQDMAVQRNFNDSTVNFASSLMSGIEGLAFIAAELLSRGYNASINEKLLAIDLHLWDGSHTGMEAPDQSTDLSRSGVVEYLRYVASYTPCKLQ